MSEQNKKLARRWFEDLFSLGDLDAANEILSAEFVDHLPREEERGIEELKNYVGIYRTAFPDIQEPDSRKLGKHRRARLAGAVGRRPRLGSSSPGPSYLVGRTSPYLTNPCAAGPLRHHRGTGRCGC